jgi:hypothetical protein
MTLDLLTCHRTRSASPVLDSHNQFVTNARSCSTSSGLSLQVASWLSEVQHVMNLRTDYSSRMLHDHYWSATWAIMCLLAWNLSHLQVCTGHFHAPTLQLGSHRLNAHRKRQNSSVHLQYHKQPLPATNNFDLFTFFRDRVLVCVFSGARMHRP